MLKIMFSYSQDEWECGFNLTYPFKLNGSQTTDSRIVPKPMARARVLILLGYLHNMKALAKIGVHQVLQARSRERGANFRSYTKVYKFGKFRKAIFSAFFNATKFCRFTIFDMLFSAVVMDLVFDVLKKS